MFSLVVIIICVYILIVQILSRYGYKFCKHNKECRNLTCKKGKECSCNSLYNNSKSDDSY